MNEKIIDAAVTEFIRAGKAPKFSKSYSLKDKPTQIVTVTFEIHQSQIANESRKFEARANTISALPSGAQCTCCGGSGRA